MTTPEILAGIVLGLLINECCDISPWLARKLVRWSAYRRYADQCRAVTRAEELVALIEIRPGKLLKLITAFGFVVAASAAFLARRVPFPMSRSQAELNDIQRRHVVDATVNCLVQSGYAGTTTARVLKLAGVSRRARRRESSTRADLVMAAARHIQVTRNQLACDKIDEIRRAPNVLEAGLELMWELHQGSDICALVEVWNAARGDLELRERMVRLESTARASLLKFTEAAFGRQADSPQFRYAVYTALDTIHGILLKGVSGNDFAVMNERWRRAKRDLLDLMEAALTDEPRQLAGPRHHGRRGPERGQSR
jgi:AcrR family transcriptional regulator